MPMCSNRSRDNYDNKKSSNYACDAIQNNHGDGSGWRLAEGSSATPPIMRCIGIGVQVGQNLALPRTPLVEIQVCKAGCEHRIGSSEDTANGRNAVQTRCHAVVTRLAV